MDVIVTGPRSVDFDGKNWLPGETIPDMDDREAKRLIGKGVVQPAAGLEAATEADKDPGTGSGKKGAKGK